MIPCFAIAEDGGLLQKIAEPGFATWLSYAVAAVIVVERIHGILSRRQSARVKLVDQPVRVTASPQYADKGETAKAFEALAAQIQGLRDQLQAQHLQQLRAAEARVSALSESFESDVNRVADKLEADIRMLGKDFTGEVGKIHDRITDTALKTAAHKARLDGLEAQQAIQGHQITTIKDRLPRTRP